MVVVGNIGAARKLPQVTNRASKQVGPCLDPALIMSGINTHSAGIGKAGLLHEMRGTAGAMAQAAARLMATTRAATRRSIG